jgi:hypothetical protein
MRRPYSHYAPVTKQADISVGNALDTLNPTGNMLGDYGIYGGAGALGGAGIGALVELLRDKEEKDYLKAMLIGGGIGGGVGLGAKGLGDHYMKDNKAVIDAALASFDEGKSAPWYRLDKKLKGAARGTVADYNRSLPLGSAPIDGYLGMVGDATKRQFNALNRWAEDYSDPIATGADRSSRQRLIDVFRS